LGANLVLDGSLQFSGNEVRATLSLLDARSSRSLRSDVITGESTNSFLLQDQIVDCVLKLLELQLESSQKKRLAVPGNINPEAYLYYTQGMGYLYGFHPKSIENAIALFQRAIDRDSKFADAHAGLGLAYWNKSGNGKDLTWADRAERECGNALDLEQRSVPALICLGTLHSGSGEYAVAVMFFEDALEIDPSSEAACRGLAQAYESQGKINDAEATYRKAVEVRGDWTSYQWLGRFYNYQARYGEAAAQYLKAAELNPDNHRPLIGLGGAHYFLGRYDEAIRAFQTANGICPTGAGYQNLGNAYLGKRQFREAVRSLEEARRLDSNNYVIAGNLAKAYYWSSGNREKAINAFREAIKLGMQELKINPRNADAHVLLARYCAMVEQRVEALQHLATALRLRPDDPEYALIAAVVHNRAGDRAAALGWLEKAVRGHYSIAEVRDDLDLSDLRSDPRFLRLIQ
jgi:serine/threonine-protein kinase